MEVESTRMRLARILEEHAKEMEKLNSFVMSPIMNKKLYTMLSKLGPEASNKWLLPDPREVASQLRQLAKKLKERKMWYHEMEDYGSYLIKLSDMHEARSLNGKLYHGHIESPFMAYPTGTIHVVTDKGYIKGTKEKMYEFV